MKKFSFLVFFLFFTSVTASFAAEKKFSFTSFYPAPAGIYDQIRLVPTATLEEPCKIGTIYNETLPTAGSRLRYCTDNSGVGTWGYLDGVWEQAGSNISLTMTDSMTYIPKVRIGHNSTTTLSSTPTLSVGDFTDATPTAEDGSIIAKGPSGVGTTWPGTPYTPGTSGTFLSYFIWSPIKNAFRAAAIPAISGSGYYYLNNSYVGAYSVGLGYAPYAPASYSTVSGGSLNQASASYSTVGGGQANRAIAAGATVGGGYRNNATGAYSVVGGGARSGATSTNLAQGAAATIIGGATNITLASYSTIGGGGRGYDASGRDKNITNDSGWSTIIGGGGSGILTSEYATVGGGLHTTGATFTDIIANSNYSFIGGGYTDSISGGSHAVIVGGESNTITSAFHAAIGGGLNNDITADSNFAFIGGGENNIISKPHATILGGNANIISGAYGAYGFIGGGAANSVSGECGALAGGQNNTAFLDYTFVGGGQNNRASVWYAMVAGGQDNDAYGAYSWAGGQDMELTSNEAFGWGASAATILQAKSFVIFPNGEGNVGVRKTAPEYRLHLTGQSMSGPPTVRIDGALFITNSLIGDDIPIARERISPNEGLIGSYDLAEIFTATESFTPGDVLVMDGTKNKLLKKCSVTYDPKVVGIVSSSPAILLEGKRAVFNPSQNMSTGNRNAPVALSGRVPCKVTIENGPIESGDLLTTSSTTGHAMKATDEDKSFGAVIGKALEPFGGGPGGEQQGTILVFISLQ